MTFKQKKSLAYLFILFCTLVFLQGIFKLPVMDRDEARYATSSKTMIETSDYIDIIMHDEVRYKKPIGVYWAQVTSNLVFGSYPFDEIWVYRIPSLLGIIFSLVLIFNFLNRNYNFNIAALSIFFLVSCFLTISEIHQAKTDGLLFLTITFCNLILLNLVNKKRIQIKSKFLFWFSFGCGVMIKGPIILIFVFFPLMFFSLVSKYNFFRHIWNAQAFLVFLVLVVPWFVIITIKSKGIFWDESLGHDLFKKISSGQESHGFPPGYYILLIFLFFWPGSVFLIQLFGTIKKKWNYYFSSKTDDCFLFFLFFVPFVLFEFIPTKLPHYVFPSYTALSILISKLLVKDRFRIENVKYSLIPTLTFPIIFVSMFFYIIGEFSSYDRVFVILSFLLIFLIFCLATLIYKKKIIDFLKLAGVFQLFVYLIMVYFLIPRVETIWISENINKIIDSNRDNFDEIMNFGFNEPSLIFLTSHKSMKKDPNRLEQNEILEKKILYIVTSKFARLFEDDPKFRNFMLINEFDGFNYSQGKKIRFKVYQN